ncbi:uncharacterized protein Dwil_GK28186 [Drosophila willistoni]|uniref:Uncharacterized protein n=1 Tax=Drosophila willistoni TaxID=7260 RepID=A0A0Q9WRX3_DROWI|nr:uncharacterized protein Dwil_GK28186 [Drosophila willistoni]
MHLTFLGTFIFVLGLTIEATNGRHSKAHDGFHNIEREPRWRNWKAHLRAHHEKHLS